MKFSEIYKKGYGQPQTTDVIEGGLCIDVSGEKAYSKNDSGEVFPIGLNEADVNEVLDAYGGFTPIGGIIMYSGQLANLSINWVICDGSNGTPNLVDKFIYGTNVQSSINISGGSPDIPVISHTHTQPSHTHTATFTGSALPTHSHNYTALKSGTANYLLTGGDQAVYSTQATTSVSAGTPKGSIALGTTAPSIPAPSGSVSGTDKNLPPYVRLAYIMRKA